MRVLISSYACEPGRGSEPGVGWGWVTHLAAHHEVWVLTCKEHQRGIEPVRDQLPATLHWVYVELPGWLRWGQRLPGLGLEWHYFFWHATAWWKARRLVAEHRIELAHHVSWMSITRVTFVSRLGVPSVVGPVDGLQICPPGGWVVIRSRFREWVRTLSIWLTRCNPLFLLTTAFADRIILANRAGSEFLPEAAAAKVIAPLQIGADPLPPLPEGVVRPAWQRGEFVVFWSGRMVDQKGLEIVIRAVAALKARHAPVLGELQIVVAGGGDATFFQKLTKELGVEAFFHFAGYLGREAYAEVWKVARALVFTGLRDTAGMVIMEAMQLERPVLVIDTGGPGEMVTPECGILVPCRTLEEAVTGIADGLERLHGDPELCARMGKAGRERALECFSWEKNTLRLNEIYAEAVEAHRSSHQP